MITTGARIARAFTTTTPFFIGVALILISLMPLSVSGGLFTTPAFPLMAIYFWGLNRPELMPPLAVFGLGVMQDLLTGGPLGLWAFVYLIAYAFVDTQRLILMSRVPHRVWMGFGLVMLVAALTAWAAASLALGQPISPARFAIQALISTAIYPVVGRLLAFVHRRLLPQG